MEVRKVKIVLTFFIRKNIFLKEIKEVKIIIIFKTSLKCISIYVNFNPNFSNGDQRKLK